MLRPIARWLQDVERGTDRYYVRTALAVQQVTRAGLNPTYSAANVDGHSIPNTGKEWLHAKTSGTIVTITLVTPGTVDSLAVPDKDIVMPATGERLIGPFPRDVYDQPGGEVHVNFSVVTGLTVGAFRAE